MEKGMYDITGMDRASHGEGPMQTRVCTMRDVPALWFDDNAGISSGIPNLTYGTSPFEQCMETVPIPRTGRPVSEQIQNSITDYGCGKLLQSTCLLRPVHRRRLIRPVSSESGLLLFCLPIPEWTL